VVAKKSSSRRFRASPASEAEQLVNGKLFMAMQAPTGVGYRPTGSTATPRVSTSADSR
jgi:hypothetical protein